MLLKSNFRKTLLMRQSCPVKDRKPMQVSESSDYTLYKKEGQVAVI